jgi:RNA polymerase sigma-70 factor (ECF subfamily)
MACKHDLILTNTRPLGMEMSLATHLPSGVLLTPLLQEARDGSTEALGQLFQACRGYLLTVARQELRAALRAKVDAADVVQETFIEATRDFAAFRGVTEQQMLSWLRGILRHNLADVTRRFCACCRCLAQEVRLRDQLAAPLRPRSPLVMDRTICEQLIAEEQRHLLHAALQRLPPLYRKVLQLRYGDRCSFAEIGCHLRRSPEAARKLWRRAVERLRQDMRVYGDA